MSYSYFAGVFRCLAGGHAHRASVITRVESDPGAVLVAGGEFPADAVDTAMSHFIIREPRTARTFSILESWDCPTCRSAEWIEAVVEDGVLRSLTVVPFDLATFRRANYVSEAIVNLYKERTGEPLYVGTEVRRGWQDRLIAAFENVKEW